MKVLITGATGLVGKQLANRCFDYGWEVNFLTTSKQKLNTNKAQGYYWNPTTQEIDPQCLEGVSVIFHLAGASVAERWTPKHKQNILNSRLQSTHLLYHLLSENNHQVKHLISASAIGIYPSSYSNFYEEDNLQKSSTFLGNVVEQWEKAVDKLSDLNIKVSKIRIGLVLAKDGGALAEMVKPVKMGVGAFLGNGKQWQSWIHIADLSALFCFVAQKELGGVFNGVAPDPVTNQYLTNAIAQQLNKKIWLPPVPKFMMNLIFGEMHEILFASQRVSAEKIMSKGFKFEFMDVNAALEDLLN